MNKQLLYETIMQQVSKSIKKAINESVDNNEPKKYENHITINTKHFGECDAYYDMYDNVVRIIQIWKNDKFIRVFVAQYLNYSNGKEIYFDPYVTYGSDWDKNPKIFGKVVDQLLSLYDKEKK